MVFADCIESGFCSQCFIFVLKHISVFAQSGRYTSKVLGVLIRRVGAVQAVMIESAFYLVFFPLASN